METKDRIHAALYMNGWHTVFAQWLRSYNKTLDNEHVERAVDAYITTLAADIAAELAATPA